MIILNRIFFIEVVLLNEEANKVKYIRVNGELENNSTNKEFLLVQNEGNRQVKRNIGKIQIKMIKKIA